MKARGASRVVLLMAVAVAALVPSLQSAYKGHGNDRDVQALLEVHPGLRGTAADSCETCHRSGTVPGPAHAPAPRHVSHCDYCHAVTDFGKKPAGPTLNAYGLAYRAAGRGAQAIKALDGQDPDSDGVPSGTELRQGTNPGDAASHPGLPLAPHRAFTLQEIRSLSPVVSARIFLNSEKSRGGDTYHHYRGNRLSQVLDAVGLAPGAQSVDVIAIDGYETTLTLDELRRSWPQPRVAGGLDRSNLGECGWVSYGPGPEGGAAGLPAAPVLLAFEENGVMLEPARLDPASGRITGKGSLRVVVPQFEPGPPDLPLTADAACAARVAPEHRYNAAYDHNAGRSVGAVAALRVNPLPRGTRDVNWRALSGGGERVVVFGALQDRVRGRAPAK